jgi:hypothetical protein
MAGDVAEGLAPSCTCNSMTILSRPTPVSGSGLQTKQLSSAFHSPYLIL